MRTDERILGEEERTATKIPHTLSATTIIGDPVVNEYGEDLGKIEELMIDLDHGRVAYAVLSFGGLFGIGDKLFAVPLEAMRVDPENHRFVLDVERERLDEAPGFDKDDWPDAAEASASDISFSFTSSSASFCLGVSSVSRSRIGTPMFPPSTTGRSGSAARIAAGPIARKPNKTHAASVRFIPGID